MAAYETVMPRYDADPADDAEPPAVPQGSLIFLYAVLARVVIWSQSYWFRIQSSGKS